MRVLMLTHRLPYAPNKGDRLRAYHMLRALKPSIDVHVLSLVHDDDEAGRAPDMADLAAAVTTVRVSGVRNHVRALPALATARPLTHVLLDAPELSSTVAGVAAAWRPDLVLAYGSGMARLAFEPALRGRPLVIDFVDVDTVKWRELGLASAWPLSWVYARESKTLGVFEAAAAERADASLVVNEREAGQLRALSPNARVHVVENGVDLSAFAPVGPPSAEPRVIFCGVMDYAPNVHGILWFARNVWPLVRSRHPHARLSVVGANPVADVRRLADVDPTVTVTGTVPAVQPYLWASAVAVAPLQTARGVQNKVLEAVAAGLPCVMTTAVAEGVPACVHPACRVADSPEPFAAAVADALTQDGAGRRATAERADLRWLDWPTRLAGLAGILDDAVRRGPHCEEAA